MSASKAICFLQPQIESLLINDIRLINPTLFDGQFIPGQSADEKTIRVALTSSVTFPVGVVLQLQLVSTIDENGVRVLLDPKICVQRITRCNETIFWFDFVGQQIPLPKGYMYLPNTLESCSSVHLQAGGVQKYCFLLSTKNCRTSPLSCPGIPFVSRVLNNAACDIKCEKPSVIGTPDESHTLKIYCKDTDSFVYSTLPHCVTHCQAPKPLILYYAWRATALPTIT